MFDNNETREYGLNFGNNPQKIDELSDTLVYIGYALVSGANPASAAWKIKKIEKVGTVWEFTYADGDDLYDNVWNNRYSLNYK